MITNNGTASVAVTNSYSYVETPATYTAKKVWDDDSNKFGLRPTSVSFALFDVNGNQIAGIPVQDVVTPVGDSGNEYSVTFTYDGNLYAPVSAREVGYTDEDGYHAFSEELTSVPGYYSVSEADDIIINVLDPFYLTIEKEFTGSQVTVSPIFKIVGEKLGDLATVNYGDFGEDGALQIMLPRDSYTITEQNADVSGYTRTTKWAAKGVWPEQRVLAESEEPEFTEGSSIAKVNPELEENYVLFVNHYIPIYNPGPGPDPGPGPINSSPTPTENIEDPEPPLEPVPSEPVDIEDGETPIAYQPDNNAPQTGDTGNILIFIIVAIMSVFGIGVIVFTGSGKKHNK
jgi:hypothetical protein